MDVLAKSSRGLWQRASVRADEGWQQRHDSARTKIRDGLVKAVKHQYDKREEIKVVGEFHLGLP